MTPAALRWVAQPSGVALGYQGTHPVATVTPIIEADPGAGWLWRVGTDARGQGGRDGKSPSERAAMYAADRAWGRWLDEAGLVAKEVGDCSRAGDPNP